MNGMTYYLPGKVITAIAVAAIAVMMVRQQRLVSVIPMDLPLMTTITSFVSSLCQDYSTVGSDEIRILKISSSGIISTLAIEHDVRLGGQGILKSTAKAISITRLVFD